MSRKVFYCKSWFRAKKRPTELWSESQARSAHESGKPYIALIDSIDRPFCFLEITSEAVGVGFLDEALRESLSYSFQLIEPGKLFLTMAIFREFVDGGDTVMRGSSYFFKGDGSLVIEKDEFSPYSSASTVSTADVSGNYSPVPEFGFYDDIIRVERNVMPVSAQR